MASRTRTKAAASTYGHSDVSNFSDGFSSYQTEPTQGNLSGNFWNQGHEGAQYSGHNISSAHGYAHDGISDPFNTFQISEDSHAMSRQDSVGAQSARTTHSSVTDSYDQAQTARMYQMSYQISAVSSDGSLRSNSPDYTSTAHMDSQNFDSYSYHGDGILGDHKMFHRNSNSSMLTDTTFNSGFASTEDAYLSTFISGQGLISKDAIYFNDSPTLLDDEFLESQRPPPMLQDDYILPPAQMMSPTAYSPSEESHSSMAYAQETSEVPRPVIRSMKKTGPRQSKVNSDIARNSRPHGTSEASDESLKYTGRTPDVDNNARVHELYHNAAPQQDGLYHCPWEGQECCQHRPEKLKCNYDKFVDSHLKPYRCKVPQCSILKFSSTACLLRHEREAHAMHGHGEKPFLCMYEGCDRAVSGNGFPRHWNLRDHMKRVHNDPGAAKSTASGDSPPPSAPAAASTRSKKRKHDRPTPPAEKSDKVVKSKSKKDSRDARPDELYQQSYQKLFTNVQKLQDPRAPDYHQLFQEVYGNIQMMQETAHGMNTQIYD